MGHRPVKNDAPGMSGQRSRNADGQLRQKRGDTQARTLEQEYGVKLNVPWNTRLDTMREKTGSTSVREVIKDLKK